MGVVIESIIWEPNPCLFIFIFICCFVSILLNPQPSKSHSPFHLSLSSSFLKFHRSFLLIFSLASVMEGLWSVYGEFEVAYYGLTKEQIVASLCIGHVAAIIPGTFLGMLSDSIGHKKSCLIFCVLHLVVGIWKRITSGPSVWLASVCLSLATSIYSFGFEAWAVVENEKQGHRQDILSDTFWLMTFFESASYIGSQALANWMVGSKAEKGLVSPYNAVIFFALICIIWISKGWKESPQTAVSVEECTVSYSHIFSDNRICLLGIAHACLQFSIVVFWILWAPTLVADGREVNLGLIYPCFMGARMLGSTIFPWLLSGPSSLRTEDCLVYTFITLGLTLSIVAYDYQEIGVLVSLFCLFHAGVGFIMPSLARLRTMHVPNELRGGMISLSLAPANAALLLIMIQRGDHNIENSTMTAFSAICLFMAAGCMHLLKRWGKQPYQNWHKF